MKAFFVTQTWVIMLFDRQTPLAALSSLQVGSCMMRKKSTSKAISRHSLFGPPPILEGEDAAAYDELFGRVCAAVKPVDVIDEMFVADVVALEWEVLRWRRLKLSLIRARGLKALEGFLCDRARLRSVPGTLCGRTYENPSGQSCGRSGRRFCADAGARVCPE